MNTAAATKTPVQNASTPAAPDYATIKQCQQATWASGDFAPAIGIHGGSHAGYHARLHGRRLSWS